MPVYEAISQKRMEEKDSSSWSNGSIKVCDGVTRIENVLKYKPHNCNRGDTYRALITDTSLLLSLSSFPPPWSRGLIYPSPFVTASFIPCHSLTNSALFLLLSSFLHHLLPIVTIHLLSPLPLLFTVLSPCHLCGIVFKMASGLLQTRGITICVCVCARVRVRMCRSDTYQQLSTWLNVAVISDASDLDIFSTGWPNATHKHMQTVTDDRWAVHVGQHGRM